MMVEALSYRREGDIFVFDVEFTVTHYGELYPDEGIEPYPVGHRWETIARVKTDDWKTTPLPWPIPVKLHLRSPR